METSHLSDLGVNSQKSWLQMRMLQMMMAAVAEVSWPGQRVCTGHITRWSQSPIITVAWQHTSWLFLPLKTKNSAAMQGFESPMIYVKTLLLSLFLYWQFSIAACYHITAFVVWDFGWNQDLQFQHIPGSFVYSSHCQFLTNFRFFVIYCVQISSIARVLTMVCFWPCSVVISLWYFACYDLPFTWAAYNEL